MIEEAPAPFDPELNKVQMKAINHEAAWRDHLLQKESKRAKSLGRTPIPSPAEYAAHLSFPVAQTLKAVGRTMTEAEAVILRPYGLAGYGEPGLTAYAIAVRKELI